MTDITYTVFLLVGFILVKIIFLKITEDTDKHKTLRAQLKSFSWCNRTTSIPLISAAETHVAYLESKKTDICETRSGGSVATEEAPHYWDISDSLVRNITTDPADTSNNDSSSAITFPQGSCKSIPHIKK